MSDPAMHDPAPAAPAAVAAGPCPRWLRPTLAVSVALNLLVAGVVAGALLGGGPWRDGSARGAAMRDAGFGPYAAALDDRDRAALRRALAARGPDLRAARDAMRRDMAEVAALIRAEPFDAEAVRAAMARGSARMGEVIGLGQSLIVGHVASLSPQERAAFADRVEAALHRRSRSGHARP